MRISDWSSDVCSSDLLHYCAESFENDGGAISSIVKHMKRVMAAEYSRDLSARISRAQRQQAKLGFKMGGMAPYGTRRRSEEHTSELQSLMRISYAVFCLNKTNDIKQKIKETNK